MGRPPTSGFWPEKSLPACNRSPETLQKGCGGAEGDRTLDLRIANATLSQLSYRPTRRAILAPLRSPATVGRHGPSLTVHLEPVISDKADSRQGGRLLLPAGARTDSLTSGRHTECEVSVMELQPELQQLLERQGEIRQAMRRPGGIRITVERELFAIGERLKKFPASQVPAASSTRGPQFAVAARKQ
jgi:hypothetical protein